MGMRAAPLPKPLEVATLRLSESVAGNRRQVALAPVQGGVALSGEIGAGGTLQLWHRLGHVPSGWIVVDLTAGFNALRRTAWDADSITLENGSPATVTCKVYVY